MPPLVHALLFGILLLFCWAMAEESKRPWLPHVVVVCMTAAYIALLFTKEMT